MTMPNTWDHNIDYPEGSVVIYSGRSYMASTDIPPNGAPPDHEGSPWVVLDALPLPPK